MNRHDNCGHIKMVKKIIVTNGLMVNGIWLNKIYHFNSDQNLMITKKTFKNEISVGIEI